MNVAVALLMFALAASSSTTVVVRAFLSRSSSTPVAAVAAAARIATSSSSNFSPPSYSSTTTQRTMIANILGLMGGGGDPPLITPDKALPGRSTTMPNIEGLRHYVLGNKLTEVPEGYKVAIFANGCFWGSEKGIWRFPFGIHSTAVGYCGGFTPNPTYEEACSGQTGHTEGVRVVYDPNQISFVDILRWFWEAHDPASGMGQGNDRGSQYRSGFYYLDDEQQQLIAASKTAYETALGMDGTDQHITTEIAAATDYDQYGGLWYFGEPYHQQYLSKPGARPYCSAQPRGVSVPSYDDWCPFADADLKEKHRPKLTDGFWKKYAPKRGCSVVSEPNEPIQENSY